MLVTIDRAGRIVVPKSLRERFNLVAGSELEIDEKGILVHHGGARASLDVAEFIRAERDSRSRRMFPEAAG